MNKNLVILLVLISLKVQAENNTVPSLQTKESQKVYEAIITLMNAKALEVSQDRKIQLNDQVVNDLIQLGILKKGRSEVSAICTDVIQ